MANIKSQKKRAITNLKTGRAQAGQRTALKSAIKEVKTAIVAKDKTAAIAALDNANKMLDKSITSNLKHGNYVARQKSRLAKALNTME